MISCFTSKLGGSLTFRMCDTRLCIPENKFIVNTNNNKKNNSSESRLKNNTVYNKSMDQKAEKAGWQEVMYLRILY